MSMKKSSLRDAIVNEDSGRVTVRIVDQGVTKDDVVNMTNKCRTEDNACCGSHFFDEVTDFSVMGKDGDISINISGKGITEGLMKEKLKACDCVCAEEDTP